MRSSTRLALTAATADGWSSTRALALLAVVAGCTPDASTPGAPKHSADPASPADASPPAPAADPAPPVAATSPAPATDPTAPAAPPPPTQSLAAAGLRVELPADWRVTADDDPWEAYAVGPAGDRRCLISWWPAGLVPDAGWHETATSHRLWREFRAARGDARMRVRERDGVVLACAWRGDAAIAEIDAIFATVAGGQPATRPPVLKAMYRQICTSASRRVLALTHAGEAWLGDLADGRLRRLAGDGYRTIVCEAERGLLLARDGSVVAVAADTPVETVTPAPTELARAGEAVALAQGLVVRSDGRLTRWGARGAPQTMSSGLPPRVTSSATLLAAWSSSASAWDSWGGSCVLADTATLWCWGSDEDPRSPPLRFTRPGRTVNTHTGAQEYGPEPFELPLMFGAMPVPPLVERKGEAMCVQIADTWTCIDRAGTTRSFPGCAAQPCRCTDLTCSDVPLAMVPSASTRRRTDEVAIAGERCFARGDAAITCHVRDREIVLRPEPESPPAP